MTEKRRLNTTEDGQLACKFGEPWMGEHPLCKAHLDREADAYEAAQRVGQQPLACEIEDEK